MATNNLISRTGSQALVPEHISDMLLKGLSNESVALQMFKHVPMGTSQTRMPVLSALPTAYFLSGDTGLKQTTEVDWTNKYLNVEEIACIVPISENVMDDIESGYDLWADVNPLVQEAFARTLDAAIIFGVNIPASWPAAIVPGAVAAGNVAVRGTNSAASGGLSGDISDLLGQVENDGYDVTGIIANRSYRGRLRQVRTTFGQELPEVSTTSAYGVDIKYPMRGLWPTGLNAAEMVAGDFTQGILGIRKDFTYKTLTEAVIQDNTGAIIYNLAQQDMVAVRFVMRIAYQVANLLNYDNPNGGTRYAFSVLNSPSS